MTRLRNRSPIVAERKNIFEASKISLCIETKPAPRIHHGSLTPYDTTPSDKKKLFSYETSIAYPMKRVEKIYRRMAKTREGSKDRSSSPSVDYGVLLKEKGKVNLDTHIKKYKEILIEAIKLGDFSEETMHSLLENLKQAKEGNEGVSELVDTLAQESAKQAHKAVYSNRSESAEIRKLNYVIKNLKERIHRLEQENKHLAEMVTNIGQERVLSVFYK